METKPKDAPKADSPKIDVSGLPIRAQIALQRFQRIASSREARLSAFVQTQPASTRRASRREAILAQIKTQIQSKQAFGSKIQDHYNALHAILETEGEEKPKVNVTSKAGVVQPVATSRKQTSTSD